MNVRVRIQFKPPTDDDWQRMRWLAECLTEERENIRVFADADPEWLVAEFTMPTETHYRAEPKISRAIDLYAGNRNDSMFGFPKSEAERARADRKSAARKARRKAKRAEGG